MKRNKKLLVSFLALNAVLSAYIGAASSQGNVRYNRLYNNIIKKIENGNSNDLNYKTIEQILNKKNKELKDLYLQNDYVVKPEYLEWQILSSGFYTKRIRGDNTLDNAKYYSVLETYSGKKTYNESAFDKLYADLRATNLLTEGQLSAILAGHYNVINSLSLKDQKIVRNILNEGLLNVSKADGFKTYANPQNTKEIDLGVNIPPKVVNREPLNPNPTIPTAPVFNPTVFNPTTPQPPVVPALTIKAFNPVSPLVAAPVLFTPPSLTYTAGGFGQTSQVVSQNEAGQGFMLGNYGRVLAETPVIISATNSKTSYKGRIEIDGTMNPHGALGQTSGILANGSYNGKMNAFYSMVGNFDTDMTGDYTVTNERTDGRTTIFISYNPYEVNTTNKVVKFDGKVTLNNSMTGGQNVLVGVEHQLLGCNYGGAFSCTSAGRGNASSIFENVVGSQIILNSGINMIGIMIDSEGTQLTRRSETINNGKIIIASNASQSIGIDFGQYQSSSSQMAPADPYVIVKTGNIIMNGTNSYGLRVGNMFPNNQNYYNNVEIDGSNGSIMVNGSENVGVSLSKQITKTTGDLIGNITNLRVTLNGDKGVGILRNKDYSSNYPNPITLKDGNIQDLILGDSVTNSILIRSDKYGIILEKNIAINNTSSENDAINNIVMTANDSNGLGSKLTFVENSSIITLGNNLSKVTGLLSMNGGHGLNTDTIIIDSKGSQGMAIFGSSQGVAATGENKGIININGEGSVGVYNEGVFEMTSGIVNVSGNKGIGVYAKNDNATTKITGGTIEVLNGGIGLYADDKDNEGHGATIELSGNTQLNVKSKGLMLYNYSGTTGNPIGQFKVTGTINAKIDSQGTAFYFKGIPDDVENFLTGMVTGTGTLSIKLTDPTSSLFVLDNPGGIINLSDATMTGIINNLPNTVTIDTAGSNPNFKPYSVFKGALNINRNVNIDDSTDAYNRSEFISSKVNLLAGQVMTGAVTGKYAIGQENFDNNGVPNREAVVVTVDNGGLINMSGSDSAGIIINYGEAVNNGQISMTGNKSIGIVSYNGSLTQNKGIIKVGEEGTGIYGENKRQSYGNGKIEIENHGLITTTAGIITNRSYGIFASNTESGLSRTDSTIKLFSGSEINMSQQNNGVGVSAKKSVITSEGKITVGENGTAVYAEDTEVNINSGEINLNGNNAVGFHLKDSVLNGNSGVINVNGQNAVLFNLDNSTFTNNFAINATPGSSYVVGNITSGLYTYSGDNILQHSNSLLLNGRESVILLDSNSSVTSLETGVVAVSVDGVYSPLPLPSPYTVEAENKGIINLLASSAGIYGRNGARIKNSGLITLGSGSVGLYATGLGSESENTGIIELGNNSTGMYQENGNSLQNKNKITSLSFGAVGIYTKNNTGFINNGGMIELSGDKSIGIYAGGGTQNINNTGVIKVGDSASMNDPGIGIYTNNLSDMITNTGTIETGIKSLGIYSMGTTVDHNNGGVIKVGNEGTGIYKDGGTLNINSGSKITVNRGEAVGIYGINGSNININSGSVIEINSGSYGAIVESGSNLNNYTTINLVDNSIFTYANGAATVTNNEQINISGSDNTVFYMVKAGNMVNNSNIVVLSGTGNIGIYNRGVYTTENIRPDGTIELKDLVTEGSIINNADISMGDSFLITNSHGIKTGYSVGIYAEGTRAENSSGKTITIGSEGVGMYVRDARTTSYNYGTIKGTGNKAIGIFADNTRVENHGLIELNGDGVIGMAGRNGAYIYNDVKGIIKVTGKNVTGIYLSGENTRVENKGRIIITNTGDLIDDQGVGIRYTENFNENNIIGGSGDISGTPNGYLTAGSTAQSYRLPELPTLINSGEITIDVDSRFSYDGIKVVVKLDPVLDKAITDFSDTIGFSGTTLPEKLEIAPDFTQGRSADRFIFKNIFRGMDGTGEYISQSLTWDATGKGSDIVMTRKAYTKFTDGLWYEDFGRVLNERYANSTGDRMRIYNKIDMIQTEPRFRHSIASLAGNVYANINLREEDVVRVFENSLQILENSSNNTKENIKVNIIAGKGKTEEDTDGVVPYKYTSTGVQALREAERTYRHTFGYSLGYLHTGFEFEDNNSSKEWTDTIQLGLHNKYRLNNWKFKNNLTGRVSFHNVDRNIDWDDQRKGTERSEMNGTYETYSITSDNVLGREISLGKKASITPYGALRAMYVTRPTFSESGLESLEIEGNDAWSMKPRAGVELKASVPLGNNTAWELKGMLDLAYEYELSGLNEREKAKLIAVEDGYHKLSKPEDEKGTFRTKALIGVEVEERYGVFLTGEYMAGNGDQDDYRAGVTLKAVF